MQQAMIQTVLVPLDELPKGLTPTSQALVYQGLVGWCVHDYRCSDGFGRQKVPPMFRNCESPKR